jgi:hypothetical protein
MNEVFRNPITLILIACTTNFITMSVTRMWTSYSKSKDDILPVGDDCKGHQDRLGGISKAVYNLEQTLVVECGKVKEEFNKEFGGFKKEMEHRVTACETELDLKRNAKRSGD